VFVQATDPDGDIAVGKKTGTGWGQSFSRAGSGFARSGIALASFCFVLDGRSKHGLQLMDESIFVSVPAKGRKY